MWKCEKCGQEFVNRGQLHSCNDKTVVDFLTGKSEKTIELFNHFISEYRKIGDFVLHPAKSRIALAARIRFAYIHRLGKDYLDVVFQFRESYDENLCFYKIANVPNSNIYNHYIRIYNYDDINEELLSYMTKALKSGS